MKVFRFVWRNIWRNPRRTMITVCSIALGLTFAIFFIALAEGAYEQMIEQMVRIQSGHVTLEHPEYRQAPSIDLWISVPHQLRADVERWAAVEETKLVVLGQGIVKSGAGNMTAGIMGVEPSVEAVSSPVARNLVRGEYLEAQHKRLVVVGSVYHRWATQVAGFHRDSVFGDDRLHSRGLVWRARRGLRPHLWY